MGREDTGAPLNVARMQMLGAEVTRLPFCTLKDAINEAFRDWVTNVETTNYIFGTAAGPHLFPSSCVTSSVSSVTRRAPSRCRRGAPA